MYAFNRTYKRRTPRKIFMRSIFGKTICEYDYHNFSPRYLEKIMHYRKIWREITKHYEVAECTEMAHAKWQQQFVGE